MNKGHVYAWFPNANTVKMTGYAVLGNAIPESAQGNAFYVKGQER